MRHIAACNTADLPGDRIAFRLGAHPVGWVRPDFADALERAGLHRGPHGVSLLIAADLQHVARALADAGHFRWRDEAFDIRARPDGPVLARLDRGALPSFGVWAEGAHLNALVRRESETFLWVARRAPDKLLDPGKLDHLAAGGIAAGDTVHETLAKEAEEEAGLPLALSRHAELVGTISYAMERPEGLRRDRLFAFDLVLPADFVPRPVDGEVEGFELWPIERVFETVRDTDDFKFNVNLVLIDLFLRRGLIEGDEAQALRAALDANCG